MKTEINNDNRSEIDVVLNPDVMGLEELVVVGYGVQRRVNLTGSISSVNFDDAVESRPITNATQALGGKATGVWVSQNSGKPGEDGAQLRVRGWRSEERRVGKECRSTCRQDQEERYVR